ncbi:MAG: hypothetical protein U1F83_03910 [Verrucomicrobiota bacterium]
MTTALPIGTINFMRIAARSAGNTHRPICARRYALPVAWDASSDEQQVVSVLIRPAPGDRLAAADHASRISGLGELVF